MTVVSCPIEGTYLIRDETQPIPLGKTPISQSVVVYEYGFGWVCGSCGYSAHTSRPACDHVAAAQDNSSSFAVET